MSICQPNTTSIPTLPFPFSAPSAPSVAINIGTPGTTCCNYTLPGFQFSFQPPIPGIAEALLIALPAIDIIMETAYAALDSYHVPTCVL